MNKTLITLSLVGLVGLGLIGGILIEIYSPESFANFTQYVITITAFSLTAITTIAGLSIINNKVDTIKTQTNGINEALRTAATQAIKDGTLPAQPIAELPTNNPLETQNGNGR